MSLIDIKLNYDKQNNILDKVSSYNPSQEERQMIAHIRDCFTKGDVTMKKPRREFNDLSVLSRMMIDQMSWNTYQPNNGEALDGDIINSWKSRAMRPIVRNKCISIAAHATARLIFPKVFAYNDQVDEQKDAATVMEDLMEWSADQSEYPRTALYSIVASLVNPASIVYSEYCEVYRTIKEIKDDGTWSEKEILDEEMSGFQDTIVPCDELYIENFYEHNIQRQGWLIWRRVISYDLCEAKWSKKYKENWQYVKPGVQILFNDANQNFYETYDSNMRQDYAEEIIFWNRSKDLKLVMVNGVLLSKVDEPNPRKDKQYPFSKTGYELIDEGKCFYYKSLVFKMQQDASIINTLYPMIIDGTYLSLMPPMINTGGEVIGSDVIVPGAVTTLGSEATITPMRLSQDITAGMNTLFKVDESISQSSANEVAPASKTNDTAYEVSKRVEEQAILLGMFVQMISQFVKEYGKLRLSDILQYLTIAEVGDITGDAELTYKSFLIPEKNSDGKTKSRKIEFDAKMPDTMTEEEHLSASYDILNKEGGIDSKKEIYRVNPIIFRKLKYMITISADMINTKSEELERAFGLQIFDRAITGASAGMALDMDAVGKDFLFGVYPKSKRDVDKYFKKPEDMAQSMGLPGMNPNNTQTQNMAQMPVMK